MLGNGPAVVNWFQSTCVACQAELGTFASVANKEQTTIHFLGIDINDASPATALAMVRRAGADYPVAEAPGIASIALATRFGVGDLPATVFVSARGSILGEVLGKVPRAELVALLANLAAGRPLNYLIREHERSARDNSYTALALFRVRHLLFFAMSIYH